ncbi:MAG: hypothetical protein Q8Q95_03095 [bacterium]|nr:hypothetical protein [bacterium]
MNGALVKPKKAVGQMVNTTARVIRTILLKDLESGFFRDEEGKIFYVSLHGKQTPIFPVLEDGSISHTGRGEDLRDPDEVIKLVNPHELGITKITWVK